MTDLSAFQAGLPRYAQLMIQCAQAETYEKFVSAVHEVVDNAVQRVEQQSHLVFDTSNAEDGWTSKVIDNIGNAGLHARPATMSGNTDITIEQVGGPFSVICESKIIGSAPGSTSNYGNGHLFEGVLQLVSRYATCSSGNDHCILMVLCFKPMAKSVLESWKGFFFDKSQEEKFCSRFSELDDYVCDAYAGMRGFFTQHIHYTSGCPVKIRHVPVSLFFDPQDKSGRKAG
ncbi:hypothetical protein KZO85_12645 [Chromohalobacter canadensis]|uniref:hypothetical protein n=1 Tax=Chromohalobacter canadensis TaxID=141389 RepID=UPI0021BE22A0|nr:hypothetical protein [Chromohalobacter canadensis]MCT8469434.1 hypothetical protein [Chromohalobacter canadensis]MCT8472058.1 hypothetical protein [Chromohalobacter canadensis]MCT8499829.1 hypothetical protein [Chromohalobacter canadensis]